MEEIKEKIASLTEALKTDLEKFVAGNKAAGRRARKISLELEKVYKQFRKVSVEQSKK